MLLYPSRSVGRSLPASDRGPFRPFSQTRCFLFSSLSRSPSSLRRPLPPFFLSIPLFNFRPPNFSLHSLAAAAPTACCLKALLAWRWGWDASEAGRNSFEFDPPFGSGEFQQNLNRFVCRAHRNPNDSFRSQTNEWSPQQADPISQISQPGMNAEKFDFSKALPWIRWTKNRGTWSSLPRPLNPTPSGS